MARFGKCFIFLGEGRHVKKKKAEQIACESALEILYPFVMYAVVQRELGTLPVVIESMKDQNHIVKILLPLSKKEKKKKEEKEKEKEKEKEEPNVLPIMSFTTFSEIREKKSHHTILIGEGSNHDKRMARQTAFQNAFQALKAFDV
jgi:thiamine pyrophosphate-dependent acetolactate synthase large subunit-like protein